MAKADKKQKVIPTMYDAVLAPVITEKSQIAAEDGKFVFKVAGWATKKQIKDAIEALFGVGVTKVNVVTVRGKVKRFRGVVGRRKDEKKAIVALAEGQSIDTSSTV